MNPEARIHERIQLPFEVEVSHPTLGSVRTIARDISEGGLFVVLDAPVLKAGAKVKLTVLHAALVENVPTPTIDMEVARSNDGGLGLRFPNHTARHLWQSVRRLRDELAIGRDYFQVFQGALVSNPDGQLLVLQQNGRWLFPGQYLAVGQDWPDALAGYLETTFGLTECTFVETVMVDSAPETRAGENATLCLFHRFTTTAARANLAPDGRYRHARWVTRQGEIDELSFADPRLRSLGKRILKRLATEPAPSASPPP